MDTQDKITQDFIADYGKLREKYQRDFLPTPQFVPDEAGGWKIVVAVQVIPIDQILTPSPFMQK